MLLHHDFTHRLLSSLFSFLPLLPSFTSAACECGYALPSSHASKPQTFYTDLLETDFLHLQTISTDTDWSPQNYTVTPAAARGPWGKNASLSNVVTNPLASKDDWAGNGVLGGDAGLELYVRGVGDGNAGGMVGMAELSSVREDILYGSFRASIKFTEVGGTCGAWFWYFNDTREIDIELLSAQQNSSSHHPINLVLQSPASAEAGFNAANTPTFSHPSLPFDPTDGFHEYRFDWSASSVAFFADSHLLATMTTSVPQVPGHVTLSQWSNGDKGWSQGPPEQDAVMRVGYVKAYFNSSSPRRQEDWQGRCKRSNGEEGQGEMCVIPDTVVGEGGLNGNATGKTFFFSEDKANVGNQSVSPGSWDGDVPPKISTGLKVGSTVGTRSVAEVALLLGAFGILFAWGWV